MENLIRNAGLDGDLFYKPVIFSVLGIYNNNAWHIKASMYNSRMSPGSTKSQITVTDSVKILGLKEPSSPLKSR